MRAAAHAPFTMNVLTPVPAREVFGVLHARLVPARTERGQGPVPGVAAVTPSSVSATPKVA
jgi:hypothetical protein